MINAVAGDAFDQTAHDRQGYGEGHHRKILNLSTLLSCYLLNILRYNKMSWLSQKEKRETCYKSCVSNF